MGTRCWGQPSAPPSATARSASSDIVAKRPKCLQKAARSSCCCCPPPAAAPGAEPAAVGDKGARVAESLQNGAPLAAKSTQEPTAERWLQAGSESAEPKWCQTGQGEGGRASGRPSASPGARLAGWLTDWGQCGGAGQRLVFVPSSQDGALGRGAHPVCPTRRREGGGLRSSPSAAEAKASSAQQQLTSSGRARPGSMARAARRRGPGSVRLASRSR